MAINPIVRDGPHCWTYFDWNARLIIYIFILFYFFTLRFRASINSYLTKSGAELY